MDHDCLQAALTDPRQQRYLELLLEKNQVLNLTGARSLDELRQRHLLDSLQLLLLPEVHSARRMLDLGSGGGLPGIPVAIALPQLELTLVDATQKKVHALEEFISALALPRVRAVAGRAEHLAHQPDMRQRYDVVVARAVAPLERLLEFLAPFCRPGGTVVCFKGPDPAEELQASGLILQRMGTRLLRRHTYALGSLTFNLLLFSPSGRIPAGFPRPGGGGKKGRQPRGLSKAGPSAVPSSGGSDPGLDPGAEATPA